MRREHVMTKCGLAETQTSCESPFSGVCGELGLVCLLCCCLVYSVVVFILFHLFIFFLRNSLLYPAATVAICALFCPFTAASNWTSASLNKQVAELFQDDYLSYESLIFFNLSLLTDARAKYGNVLHCDSLKSNAIQMKMKCGVV